MKILIIIVTFNSDQFLSRCLNGLKIFKDNADIVISNNGEKVKNDIIPSGLNVEILNNIKNIGFAAGVNSAIKSKNISIYNWIWILNPDTEIVKCENNPIIFFNLQEKLIFKGEKSQYFPDIWSPVIYDAKDKIWFSGGKINLWTGECSHETNSARRKDNQSFRQSKWVSGCSMFVKPEVFKKIGNFDEQFFLFYEDVDFCVRARDAGYIVGVIFCRELGFKIIHHISSLVKNIKTKQKYSIEQKSKWHFFKKHWFKFSPSVFAISWLRNIKHNIKLSLNN